MTDLELIESFKRLLDEVERDIITRFPGYHKEFRKKLIKYLTDKQVRDSITPMRTKKDEENAPNGY